MRSAYEPIPWLAADNTPRIKSTTGLGTGGGAGVSTQDSSGFGEIDVKFGVNHSANVTVVLNFPSTPPTLFISGEQCFGTVTQATVSNDVTITCTGILPGAPGELRRLHYEWATSQ